MIKYIGSKRKIIPKIVEVVQSLPDVNTACDLFTGTTRVAQAFKKEGIYTIANDLASYSRMLTQTYISTDKNDVDMEKLNGLITHLNGIEGKRGYFTKTFCEDARYFQPKNGERVDAIREEIDNLSVDSYEKAILITSLMLAADKVDSTTGLQMAYLKKWAPRSFSDLELKMPELLDGNGESYKLDAREFVQMGLTRGVDLTYIDPPYNQHSYFGNYHIWETLVRNDAPEAYGIANKRVDNKTTKSPYNSKRKFKDEFTALIHEVESKYLLVSFNNEGFISTEDMEALLNEKGAVTRFDIDYGRYVGATIGIHNLDGEKVGSVSHTRNVEHLFLVSAK